MTAAIESFARLNGTQPAWHGLGGTWNTDATLEEKAIAAGMNWTVESSPVFYRVGNEAKVSPKHQLFYRSDQPDHVIAVPSDQFKPVQPMDCLEFLSELEDKISMTIDTAGVLQGGNRYWALAKVDDGVNICGEQYHDYLLHQHHYQSQ